MSVTESEIRDLPDGTILRYNSEIWERQDDMFRCYTSPYWTFGEWEELTPNALYWYAFDAATETAALEVLTARPSREDIAAALGVHRWKSMGVTTVECECGAVLRGDWGNDPHPADEAFRLHLADEFLAFMVRAS